jgi:hypothetical protein
MKMLNVMQRLAELDSGNPNVVPATEARIQPVTPDMMPQLPDLTEMSELRSLSGLKPVNECGIMPMGEMGHHTPASFSINASAANGDEVAGMLSQIMNLAGVHQVGPQHMPVQHGSTQPLNAEPAGHDEPEIMRSMLDKMNDPPEDEGAIGAGLGAMAGGAMAGIPGAVAGGAMGGSLEDESAGSGEQAEPGTAEPMQSMADEIRSMADKLKGIEDKDELNLEDYDNTPNAATSTLHNDYAYQPNNTQVGNRMDGNMPKGNVTFEDQLMAEYKKFVAENKKNVVSEISAQTAANVAMRRGQQVDQMAANAPGGAENAWASPEFQAAHTRANRTLDKAVARGATDDQIATAYDKVQGQQVPTSKATQNAMVKPTVDYRFIDQDIDIGAFTDKASAQEYIADLAKARNIPPAQQQQMLDYAMGRLQQNSTAQKAGFANHAQQKSYQDQAVTDKQRANLKVPAPAPAA